MWKVGELARQIGVTVRTLHHYHEIGLLVPSGATDAGHRLYTDADVGQLHRVLSLRQLGFTLDQIRDCLTNPEYSPRAIVELQLRKLSEQIAAAEALRQKLSGLQRLLEQTQNVSAEQFLETMEAMHMFDKYYTPEQMADLQKRYTENIDRVKEVEAEWPRLMAAVQAEMDKGTPPSDPTVKALAQKWMGLVNEFTGGDPKILQSLNNMYQNESNVAGMDVSAMRPMMEYIQKAMAIP